MCIAIYLYTSIVQIIFGISDKVLIAIIVSLSVVEIVFHISGITCTVLFNH